ncbi:c-type cytochrome [Aureibaculum sp. A20]|uniref:C-type cytochrome n=1 Tax=Aureibaculum flavum TaxID=2795986 RepID=A0ABS0WU63_9FLAO|nr:c-type cytochrome [Aureibaculum flavum]MBJ2175511.1 c-type cytochrome [Aureibaculum flavum]
MKKLSILFIALAMIATSCGDKKKEDVKKDVEQVKEEVVKEEVVKETTTTDTASDKDTQIAMGKKLFTDKTCTTCHALDTKVIGPSLKDIIKIYEEKDANIVKFLKGNADAIVDTDPGQVAIMKANLDGFVKDMSAEELQALSAYMRDAGK